jgi:hypothetical protein
VSQLGTFFNGTDTRLGVFYPDHSLIAMFQNLGQAHAAILSLCGAGFSDDEVLAASGADLSDLVHEESAGNGPLGYLITAVGVQTSARCRGDDSVSRRNRGSAEVGFLSTRSHCLWVCRGAGGRVSFCQSSETRPTYPCLRFAARSSSAT